MPTIAETLSATSEFPCRELERQLNPVVSEAAEALQRQKQKPRRILDLDDPILLEGIHLLPRWEGHDLLRIRQRRDSGDLLPRGKSAHDVSFAPADLRLPTGMRTITVAIKGFDDPIKAIEDATANSRVLNRGFDTTDPICVIVNTPRSFIVTPAKEGVQSVDTEPWHQFLTNPDLRVTQHFERRLTQISEILANLNFRGIDQADSQLRNYWITPEGKMEPIDWESTNVVSDPPTPEELQTISVSTLRPLYGNLSLSNGSPAIFRGPLETKWDQFANYVVDPYLSRLEQLFIDSGYIDMDEKYLDVLTCLKETLKLRLGLH
jgi:hypothetical protein